MRAHGLCGRAAYMAYLEDQSSEWAVLDALCRISISRFYRDRGVFDALGATTLPELAERAAARSDRVVRCWSAGCASGEEPYSLALVWDRRVRARHPQAGLAVVATDADARLLGRARSACYPGSSLKELPRDWVECAFDHRGRAWCLRDRWKQDVEFCPQDVREAQPEGLFDLVLCRNLVFTYFDAPLQHRVLSRMADQIRADGFLVIGRHESLPAGVPFRSLSTHGIYRKAR
jgi:chemotaxis protein methyltransferase CheR